MLRYGLEVILLAQSDEFGRMVREIVGRMGLRDAARLTGLSAAYIGAMKDGHVPLEESLAKFAAGYKLQGEYAKRFFEVARLARPDLDPEAIIQFGCDAAGYTTMERLAVVEEFRRQESTRGVAAKGSSLEMSQRSISGHGC